MSSTDAILKVLEAQRSLYNRLHELLQRERRTILNFDPEKIEELAKEKDALVLQIQMLETERKRLVQEFFRENGSTKSIMDLYEATGDERFLQLRLSLMSLLQSIQEANEVNRYFIERACQYIEGGISFLKDYVGQGQSNRLNREA